MPQCKMSGCKGQAVPHAPKMYCQAHLGKYIEKRKSFLATEATLDNCINGNCRGKVSPGKRNFCNHCQQQRNHELGRLQAEAQKQRVFETKLEELDACCNIHDIKQFLKNQLLENGP